MTTHPHPPGVATPKHLAVGSRFRLWQSLWYLLMIPPIPHKSVLNGELAITELTLIVRYSRVHWWRYGFNFFFLFPTLDTGVTFVPFEGCYNRTYESILHTIKPTKLRIDYFFLLMVDVSLISVIDVLTNSSHISQGILLGLVVPLIALSGCCSGPHLRNNPSYKCGKPKASFLASLFFKRVFY